MRIDGVRRGSGLFRPHLGCLSASRASGAGAMMLWSDFLNKITRSGSIRAGVFTPNLLQSLYFQPCKPCEPGLHTLNTPSTLNSKPETQSAVSLQVLETVSSESQSLVTPNYL